MCRVEGIRRCVSESNENKKRDRRKKEVQVSISSLSWRSEWTARKSWFVLFCGLQRHGLAEPPATSPQAEALGVVALKSFAGDEVCVYGPCAPRPFCEKLPQLLALPERECPCPWFPDVGVSVVNTPNGDALFPTGREELGV